MTIFKGFVLFFAFASQFAFGSQELFSTSAKSRIVSEINANGSARVIVGVGKKFDAKTLSTSAMQKSKASFLISSSLLNAQIDQSITMVDELEHLPFVVMDVKSEGLKMLMSHSQVASIEPDRKLKALLKTAVPKIVGESNPWKKSIYNGQGSWVAVLDSGVNVRHPMFRRKPVIQACFTSDRSCPNGGNTQFGGSAANPLGKSDHGTHVAGIAVGNYIASKRLGGVAHKAGLIAIQVFNRNGIAFTSSIVRGLNYVYSLAASRRVAAANLSLGSASVFTLFQSCEKLSPSTTFAIAKLRSRKVATVIASGNNGSSSSTSFPSCILKAIAVASSRKDYKVSNFSNRNRRVSLIAPGSSIQSASYGAGYKIYSGTSMATPMIAGSFAVMRKNDPSASVSAIETALQNGNRTVLENYFGEPKGYNWPLLNKARTNIGGTTQRTTAVGFNTHASLNRFNKMSTINWRVATGTVLGAKGVAYTNAQTAKSASLVYPQSIFNGRISARLKNDGGNRHGLIIRVGGTNNDEDLHDGYLFRISNTSYEVTKYEHGISESVISSRFPPPPYVKSRDWNTLLVTTGGKTVKFYINGNFIGQHSSNRLIYGAPGIFTIGNARTYVDWFITKSNAVNSGYN